MASLRPKISARMVGLVSLNDFSAQEQFITPRSSFRRGGRRGTMNMKTFAPLFASAGLLVGASVLLSLTGCVADGGGYYRGNSASASIAFTDDYDYYPGYETYYSRNRHEYVYRDGNTWVRRSEPFGVRREQLTVAPVVRMDFHDAPEHHHDVVVRQYPRNWKRDDKHDDRRDDRRDHDRHDDKQ